jgi:hypothetical protein
LSFRSPRSQSRRATWQSSSDPRLGREHSPIYLLVPGVLAPCRP